MTGLLDTNFLQAQFGAVLSSIYGDGELIPVKMDRQPGGSMKPVEQPSIPIKVQVDNCDEAMREQVGFADTDVKLIILQSGVSAHPDSDSIVIAQGRRWRVSGVRADPARASWVMRGIREAGD